MVQCRHLASDCETRHPEIAVARVSQGARATMIARIPRRTLLQCQHELQLSAHAPRRALLQCRHEARDGGSRHLEIPITLAPIVTCATVIARVPRRTLLQCLSARSPIWWLAASQDSNHTRTSSRARYSDRTRPEAYVATMFARNPKWWLAVSRD